MSGVQSGPVDKGTLVRHPLTIAAQRCVRAFKKAWYTIKYEHEEVIETERVTDQEAARIFARVCQDKSLAAPPRDPKTGEILITKGCVWYSISAVPAVQELLLALHDYVQADNDDLHLQIATRYGPGRSFPSGNLPPDKNGWPVYGGIVGRLNDWHAFAAYTAQIFANQCEIGTRNDDDVIQYRPNEAYELFFDRVPQDIEADLMHEAAALVRVEALTKAATPQEEEDAGANIEDRIPIAWLRRQVTQKVIAGASDKVTKWLRARKVKVVKIANRMYCERDAALTAFHDYSDIKRAIHEYKAHSETDSAND